ncbi:MAG: hypothetical protein LBV52_05335 [Spirochaetaceae bacterium]|jgi:hypothetical protein|nr:hypothetical protein [Spirochaetaceae bacterium]
MNKHLLLAFTFIGFISPTVFPVDFYYYIRNINFEIDGKTKPLTVLRITGIKENEKFSSTGQLEKYIDRKEQILKNQRIFESASITYIDTRRIDQTGNVAVDLVITVVDTENFIVFPEPKLNNGFISPSIKLRDYNFFGTASELSATLGYDHEEENEYSYAKDNFNFELSFGLPFRAFDLNWVLIFDNYLKYFINENLLFKNTTGLAVDIPIGETTLTLGYSQGTAINDEYETWEKYNHNWNVRDTWYLISNAWTSLTVPLGIETDKLGMLNYVASAGLSANYSKVYLEPESYGGPSINVSQYLGFSNVNWIDNFKQGYRISLGNNNYYNMYFNNWYCNLNFETSAHFLPFDILGLSFRFGAKHWFEDLRRVQDIGLREEGGRLRGIDDDAFFADTIFSLNMDFSILLFQMIFSDWTNIESLEYFNFEFHLGGFVDVAAVQGRTTDSFKNILNEITLNPNDWLVTAGAEAFVFPLAFRSVFLRFSIGFNLRQVGSIKLGDYQFSLGIGSFY